MSRNLLKALIPVVVLLAGVVAAILIVSGRKAPPRAERPALGPLVEVIAAEVGDVPVLVKGHGEVVPTVAVDLVPQVSDVLTVMDFWDMANASGSQVIFT
jgi:multidrug efflux pump subunit AcrA (membrane-fusion protein)